MLKSFIHLRFVDLSHNKIKDIIPLNPLKNMLVLKLDYNRITNVILEPMPFLQQASFSNNMIRSIENLKVQQNLAILNLNGIYLLKLSYFITSIKDCKRLG